MSLEFKAWPKIARVENRKPPVFTEKIDGTNACIAIADDGKTFHVQSRNRIITPDSDNFGFARWVYDNIEELLKIGPGYHFGEWWGSGVGRTYDMDKKVFSVFNTHRWLQYNPVPDLVDVVPVLPVRTEVEAIRYLQENGSIAVRKYGKEYNRPEGAIMFDVDTQTCFKIIMDK